LIVLHGEFDSSTVVVDPVASASPPLSVPSRSMSATRYTPPGVTDPESTSRFGISIVYRSPSSRTSALNRQMSSSEISTDISLHRHVRAM